MILHWLGAAFDPALAGYWGAPDFEPAAGLVVELAERADGKVAGVKLSVLDAGQEVALRRRLPPGVRLYTGDDFHYDELIRGDADGHSDALLGRVRRGDRARRPRRCARWTPGTWPATRRPSGRRCR